MSTDDAADPPRAAPTADASQATATADTAAPSEALISARGVEQRFGDDAVLDSIDLDVHSGQIYGLVGPSGCGKTTLIRILLGLLVPTAGEIRVHGVEPKRFKAADRRMIGYLPQDFSLYPNLTVAENARFVASLYGMGWLQRRGRIRELLTFLEIWDARKRLARDISGGMRRRLGLATALLHRPRLLVVDEPAAGLDPALRIRIWEYLREIQRTGTTILLTTQHIDEAEHCDRVGVLSRGRIIASGSPEELRRIAALADYIEIDVPSLDRDDILAVWRLPGIHEVRRAGEDRLLIRATESELITPLLAEDFAARGKPLHSLETHQAGFDDVFMQLVARA